MDLTLMHPKIVHLPIALAVLMPLLSLGLLVAWWRDWLPKKAWLIAAIFQGVLVVSSFAALQTGEADEEAVEAVVAENHIETHEEAAELFTWAAGLALILFGAAAVSRGARTGLGFGALSVAASVVVFGLGYRVGDAGGSLVYDHGAASAFDQGPGGAPARSAGHAEEDDD